MSEPVRCTYCGGDKFYEGPSGPGATNILCANDECRHWFNSSVTGLDDLHRVEPTVEEKEAKRAEKKAENAKHGDGVYAQGKVLFNDGHPSRDCLLGDTTKEDLLRLSGWMDAAFARTSSNHFEPIEPVGHTLSHQAH